MLLSSYFIPHSPILIPRIGKEHTDALPKTKNAFAKIKMALEAQPPDTIITLSAHAPVDTNTINLNLSQEYKLDLSEFGDLTTRQTWRPDMETINHIAYATGPLFDINLISHKTLDYGSAIPLHLLTENISSVKIIPITYAELSLPEVYRFGMMLEKELYSLHKRFVILATGDLSHRLSKESPSGYSKQAKAFDAKIQDVLLRKAFDELLAVSNTTLTGVGQCGIRALLILAGAMEKKNTTVTTLSYENSLGVGYLSAAFELQH